MKISTNEAGAADSKPPSHRGAAWIERAGAIRRLAVLGFAVWLGSIQPGHGQWQTQSILVAPGWSAIYLHVDPSYASLDSLVGSDGANPITEVWLWSPSSSTVQYVTSPQQPVTGNSEWITWVRGGGLPGATLSAMLPNAAYLIHSVAATNYTWRIKGIPAVPYYTWTTTGINFLGFPTVPANPPALETFLSPVASFQGVADIYQYLGGDLGPNNPSHIFATHTVAVTRGKAFWIRSGAYYNNYFGPFRVALGTSGIAFGDASSQSAFHLQNTTSSNLTVSVTLLPSEAPPPGQTPVLGMPPLIVRGPLDTNSPSYTYSNLAPGTNLSWQLAPQGQPNSDIVINLGVNRSAFPGTAGGFYAGILQFTDSFHFTEVDVPVSATPASYAGLWVGSARVSQVANYLKSYQLDVNNNPVLGTNGAYVVTGVNTNLGDVSTPFPLTLILHNTGTNVVLLQRVFCGLDAASNAVVAASEQGLHSAWLSHARRITAVQLPVRRPNQPWPFAGQLVPGGTLTTTVDLPYDDQASNPFLHTYHPDHDNLDFSFQRKLPVGSESYGLARQITLTMTPPGNDFGSLTQYGQVFQGAYAETITVTGLGGATRSFNVGGGFALTRISPVAVLTQP